MSTAIRDKVIAYAGQGVHQAAIATACGITPSYVSQLLDLEEVKEAVAQLRAGKLEAAMATDNSIEEVERSALAIVKAKLPFVRDAVSAVKIFTALNSAKKKATPIEQGTDAMSAQQVTITVPRGAAVHFKINEVNQVIEVEGRTMAALPSRSLPDLQRRLAANRLEVTAMQVMSVTSPELSAAQIALVAQRERQETADTDRASRILADLTMHIDGVEVVL